MLGPTRLRFIVITIGLAFAVAGSRLSYFRRCFGFALAGLGSRQSAEATECRVCLGFAFTSISPRRKAGAENGQSKRSRNSQFQ